MKKPLLPDNEWDRVCALHNLNILDSVAEERFDRITRLAKKLFKVPIVLMSFIDGHRQWIKSKQGIAITEVPREISFCSHTILEDNMMVVEDTSQDIRFFDNPFVVGEPYIRSYIGYPIKLFNQYNVGTLCLIDTIPRQFKLQDMRALKDLAAMVQAELELTNQSSMDDLTSLVNRQGFLSMAEFVYQYCQRETKPLMLLYFDLKKFKEINDTLGYATGDEVLKIFANALRNSFRSADVIARIGGDQFSVLCSNLVRQQVPDVLHRLKENVKERNIERYPIHYSAGFIELEHDSYPSINAILVDADKRMYEKKFKT
jgi:diguanylate cyclase (GGDEF)-like protein